jgi:hypothetical protein
MEGLLLRLDCKQLMIGAADVLISGVVALSMRLLHLLDNTAIIAHLPCSFECVNNRLLDCEFLDCVCLAY